MHLTEGRNIGFQKILNALERNGSPKPIFETDPERLSFSTTLFIHPNLLPRNEGINDKAKGKIMQTEQMVLDIIESDPSISIAKMIKGSGLSRSSIERAIRSLKEKPVAGSS